MFPGLACVRRECSRSSSVRSRLFIASPPSLRGYPRSPRGNGSSGPLCTSAALAGVPLQPVRQGARLLLGVGQLRRSLDPSVPVPGALVVVAGILREEDGADRDRGGREER